MPYSAFVYHRRFSLTRATVERSPRTGSYRCGVQPVSRGRLAGPSAAPPTGERTDEVARIRNLVIEEIVTGTADTTVDYQQEQDEWVVVLSGSADLEVAGETVALTSGDWLLIPAETVHRLVRVDPGTQWLAVHLFRHAR
jgi:cupin 2 domain-containing protein